MSDSALAVPVLPVIPGPLFLFDSHVSFIVGLDSQRDSFDFVAAEHLRMSGIYWGLCALSIVGRRDALDREGILTFVRSCWCEKTGGYSGAPGHDAHLLYTLSALQILALLEIDDEVDVPAVRRFVRGLQREEDGSFTGDSWGERDSRFTYCAFQAAALLGGGLEATVNVQAALGFIDACRNFDGGYGAVPGAESHAGQIFCAVGALSIAAALDRVDANLLGWWLAERQVDSGGLNGRPEKQADVCYSWWILSALELMGRTSWIDGSALAHFILSAQDSNSSDDNGISGAEIGKGGIADRAGNCADVFHTFFGIAGLSLLNKIEDVHNHDPINAAYALPRSVVKRLSLPHTALPNVPTFDEKGVKIV